MKPACTLVMSSLVLKISEVSKDKLTLSTLPPFYAAPPRQLQRLRTIVAFDLCQQHVHIALVRLVTGLKNGFAFIKEEHLNSKRTNRFVTRTEEYFSMKGGFNMLPP